MLGLIHTDQLHRWNKIKECVCVQFI